MEQHLQITILVDNVAWRPDLQAEHGLSMWIEYGDRRILWDTGQGGVLSANAKSLGVDLTQADIIALSHGHYDHTGGLPSVLPIAPDAEVWMHPLATVTRFSRKETVHPVGMPAQAAESLQGRTIHWIKSWTAIHEGVFLTGSIPRNTPYEDTGGAFFLDADCQIPDMLPDDQALVAECSKGLVVVLGCAHSGVVNTLDYVHLKTSGKPIYAVMGGMHLSKASQERLDYTVQALKKYDVQIVLPLHCTGERATHYLRTALPDRSIQLSNGPLIKL
ncbi:MAG: MBL fold metallo-hydrolase [Sedimentisphaerales bacterium]|nr:MBL fold metallo-hydrolase [Sedimentisphaerales bacterium]